MAIKLGITKDAAANMAAAIKSGDQAQIEQAWDVFHGSVVEQVKSDARELKNERDSRVLEQRGYRQLTQAETKFYVQLADILRSESPKQAFVDLIGEDGDQDIMPQTIIEDIYRDLTENHPLLQKISVQYVGYVTKWIINKNPRNAAVWGKVNSAITEEIESALEVIDVVQAKLSCFAFIELDMLELGPKFLDAYIRRVLTEAMAIGFEQGIVGGTGLNQLTGMDRDIHDGVSFSTSTGYPRKTAVDVTSFMPAEYGALVAKMAKTETGVGRVFDKVLLICNMTDYLTKIMPATTALATSGVGYVHDLFPFPTETAVSNELADGEAILCLPENYMLLAGGEKNKVIEFSDDYKFLEDQRYFKIKQFASGRCVDNTCSVLLDISDLDPAYITVNVANTVNTTVSGTVTTKAEETDPVA
jgi:rubrerythrin